jgi:hypothetical protein
VWALPGGLGGLDYQATSARPQFIVAAMKMEEIKVDYVVVDTLRVPRETFAAILQAWRDGYAESIGELTPISRESAVAYFNQMIGNIRDPRGYAVWMVPVVSARVP